MMITGAHDPHPARKSAPTSPFQGEVGQAARAALRLKALACRSHHLPLKGGGRRAQRGGWGSQAK